MPASEEAYRPGPDGEPHPATLDRVTPDPKVLADVARQYEELGLVEPYPPNRGQLSEQRDKDFPKDGLSDEEYGFTRPATKESTVPDNSLDNYIVPEDDSPDNHN